MAFTQLTETEYERFLEGQSRVFFTQLPSYADVRVREGYEVQYVGVRAQDGTVIAAATAILQPWKRVFRRVLIPYGPQLDWDNTDLVREFFHGLSAHFHRDRRVLAVRVNPLLSRHFYEDIEVVGDNPQATAVEEVLFSLDAVRLDYDSDVVADVQEKFAFVKDIGAMDYKQVVASCGQVVRTGFNRLGTNGVRVEFRKPSDIGILKDVLAHTAERTDMHEFSDSTFRYYKDLMEGLGEDEAFLPVAILDCREALDLISKERDEVNAKLEQLAAQAAQAEAQGRQLGKKQRNARKECEARLQVLDRRATENEEIRAESGDDVVLAASLFIHSPHELVYLVSGAYSQYQSHYGIYLIHRAMIEWSVAHDVRWYNMFGITGDFTEDASDAGVLHFKRQFKGNVEEYVGTYVLPIRPRLAKQLDALS